MRRKQRSYLASFVYGVVIATGTAVGLMVTHHLLAPPPGDDIAESVRPVDRTSADGVRKWAVPLETAALPPPAVPMDPPRLVSGPTPATPPAKSALIANPPPKAGEAQRALARNIQRELKRVGCYAGSLDGDWTASTQTAMRAFNDSVRIQLPVQTPDYILLTLLQGHATRACAPVAAPSITATAPTVPARPAKRTETPIQAASPVPRPAVIAQPRPAASQPAPSPLVPPVAVTEPVAGPVVIPSAAPIPGRMAIGGPPPAQIPPPSPYPVERVAVPPPSLTETVYPTEPPRAAERRVTSPRATYPRRARSTRGTFTELNRNAP